MEKSPVLNVSGVRDRKAPATYSFAADLVKISRVRQSTTQGSFSIAYRDQVVATYGDNIQLSDLKNEAGQAEWKGCSDEEILAVARRLYSEGDPYNRIAPLFHKDVIELLAQGEAVVLSSSLYDKLADDMPKGIASIPNPRRVGLKDEWLVGTKAALRQAEPGWMADHEMQQLVDTLKSRHPNAGLSFGYIGNCGIGPGSQDDRSWRIFTKVPKDPGKDAGCFSWGGYSSDRLPEMFVRAEKELENWVRCVVAIDPWPQAKRVLGKGSSSVTGMGM